MKKIKLFTAVVIATSLIGFTSFAAVSTLQNGAKTIDSADITVPINENAALLDDHIDNIASTNTLGHVKIGAGLVVSTDGTVSANAANYVYSETEVDTGKKWLKDEKIYSKTFDLGTVSNNNSKSVSIADLNVNQIISMTGTASGTYSKSSVTIPIPYSFYSGSVNNLQSASIWQSNSDLNVRLQNLSDMHVVVTIEYLKNIVE